MDRLERPPPQTLSVGPKLGSTLDLDQTSVETDEEEAEYLKAHDYESTQTLSVTHLTIVGTVLFQIWKESRRLPERSIDSRKFHYAPDAIKQASISLIAYRGRCTCREKSLHKTSFPS